MPNKNKKEKVSRGPGHGTGRREGEGAARRAAGSFPGAGRGGARGPAPGTPDAGVLRALGAPLCPLPGRGRVAPGRGVLTAGVGTRGGARSGREGAGAVAEVVDPASRTWKWGFGVRAAGAREGPRPRRRGASGPRLVLRKSGLLSGGPPWTPKCCHDRGGGGDGRERVWVLRVRGGGGVLLLQVEL